MCLCVQLRQDHLCIQQGVSTQSIHNPHVDSVGPGSADSEANVSGKLCLIWT